MDDGDKRMDCLNETEIIRCASGELSAPEAAVAQAHLAECGACREEVEALREVVSSVSNLARRTLCEEARREIMARAEELLPMSPAKRKEMVDTRRVVRGIRWASVPALTASAAAAALAVVLLKPPTYEPEDVAVDLARNYSALLRERSVPQPMDARALLAGRPIPSEDRTAV